MLCIVIRAESLSERLRARSLPSCFLTSRRSQPPLALAVPLSRFMSRVGGGSAFFVRLQAHADFLAVVFRKSFLELVSCRRCDERFESFWFEPVAGSFEL